MNADLFHNCSNQLESDPTKRNITKLDHPTTNETIAGGADVAGSTIKPKSGSGTYTCAVWENGQSKIDPNSLSLTVEVYSLSVTRKNLLCNYECCNF